MRFSKPILPSLFLLYIFGQFCAAQESVIQQNDKDFHQTPQTLFVEFAKRHNSGQLQDLLPLLSQKTKALLLFSKLHFLGMAPEAQRREYSDWEQKWSGAINEILKDVELDWQADYSPIVLPLSKWRQLDTCLDEMVASANEHNPLSGSPRYSSQIDDLQQDEAKAKGSIRILVNGGIVAGLNGNSLEWIDIDPIPVYFVLVDEKWFVCNETEYQGNYKPRPK